jgi:DNA-binding transcriptional LysR family regulator
MLTLNLMLTSQDLEFFETIANSPSLAAAARSLNVTPPSISQRLQALEKKLNVKLVERSVRSTTLTEEGEKLASKGRKLLVDIESLQNEILADKHIIEGELRVLAPLGFGIDYVAPLITEFQERYPNIDIDLTLSDIPRWTDRQHPDVMVYIGELKSSSLKCIHLAENRRLLLASPSYLKKSPSLLCPQDLHNHQCIALRENDEDVTMWKFEATKNLPLTGVRIHPRLSSNVGQVVKDWAVEGQGIIQRSEWHVTRELKSGELVSLLPEFPLPRADVVALVSDDRQQRPMKVNLFLDFLKARLVNRPWYNKI